MKMKDQKEKMGSYVKSGICKTREIPISGKRVKS